MLRLTLAFALVFAGLVMAAAPGAPAIAATLTVCPSGPPQCPYSTIQSAINAAAAGDTIFIQPGPYTENLSIGVATATPLTLIGFGATVDGGAANSVLDVKTGHTVTIVGLTLTNGKAGAGGGIRNEGGTVNVLNGHITGNTAFGPNGRGGGIDNGGTMTLTNTKIDGNTAARGGGVFSGSQTGSTFITLNNSPIINNTASNGAGGMATGGGANLVNSPITNNTGGNVGGFSNASASSTVTLTNSPVENNHATATSFSCATGAFGIAGGIGNAGAPLSLVNSPVVGNTTTGVSGSAGGINNQTSECPPGGGFTAGIVTRVNSAVRDNTLPQCLGTSC